MRHIACIVLIVMACFATAQNDNIALKPQDQIRFVSSAEATLNFDVEIGNDGSVWLPRRIRIIVAGTKWNDAKAEIASHLQYSGFNILGLEIRRLGMRSHSVSITGAVRFPGSHPWSQGLRLSDIVLAAKPTPRADLDLIEILDTEGKKTTHRFVTLKATSEGWNVPLKPGDTVTFPLLESAAEIFVLGEVRQPSKVDFSIGLSVKTAIGLAGGISGNGNPEAIEIWRNGKLIRTINLNVGDDFELERSDRIIVTARKIDAWIAVGGAVGHEGQYAFKEGMRLTDAINLASGFSPLAVKTEIFLVRLANGKFDRFKFNYDKILRREQENPILKPGDSIEVKARKPSAVVVQKAEKWSAEQLKSTVSVYLNQSSASRSAEPLMRFDLDYAEPSSASVAI
jgi:polysaccharide export outer membrane protein